VVLAHHERPDGRGYPRALQGAAVSLEVRVVGICDAWAAMRARRHYGAPLSREDARRELESGRGTQFDAGIVDTFLGLEAAGVIGAVAEVPAELAAAATAAS
jgi:two-component system cell cycle response regulator